MTEVSVEILLVLAVITGVLFWIYRKNNSPAGSRSSLPQNPSIPLEINRREEEEINKIQEFIDSLAAVASPGLDADERNALLAVRQNRLLSRCGIDMKNPDETKLLELIIRSSVFDLLRPMPPLSAHSGIKKMVERRLLSDSQWEASRVSSFMERAHTYALLGSQSASLFRLKLIDVAELARLAMQDRSHDDSTP